jgi:hypothetical protein
LIKGVAGRLGHDFELAEVAILPLGTPATRAARLAGVGLWQRIRRALIRDDEPGIGEDADDGLHVSTVPYATAELTEEHGAEESADEQREGDGFR